MASHQLKTERIYCGDNLEMLKEVPDESVDLIYIDPPFNSNRTYEVFWGDTSEKRAFDDRFGDAEAYITYMRPRVVEMYRVLKQTGSFYYHCDWHASHYIKVILDQIFNANNFQNEIVWPRTHAHGGGEKGFSRIHDTIFFYTKSPKFTFNKQYQPYSEEYIANFFKYKDEKGRYRLVVAHGAGETKSDYEWKGIKVPKGRHWAYKKETMEKMDADGKLQYSKTGMPYVKQYLDEKEGTLITDIWSDIEVIHSQSKERLGYPTQKPIALLDRILSTSSNKGDVVLDAFCGCGTALISAQKLGRKWIGIDISPTACRVMAQRLWDTFKLEEGKDFELINMLRNEAQLRQIPPFEFENWAVIALGGIPNKVKVGDYGIDGKLYPIEKPKAKQDGLNLFGAVDTYYPIQVKQMDKVGRPDIDNFETAMRRDKRHKGYFISFDFSSDAINEIKRLDKEGELEIIPVTVKELLDKSGFEVVV